MKAKLISYTLDGLNPTQKRALSRTLFGYKDFSNNKTHIYQRKGLLDTIDYIKPQRSVLIIKNKDEKMILEVLNKYKLKIKKFDIEISSKYFQEMPLE